MTFLNQVYDNKVIADTFEEQILTKLNANDYLTVDQSLQEKEGLTKRVKKYSGIGGVQHLGIGEGNTEKMSVRYSYIDYKVGRTQGEWDYVDDEYYDDNVAIEEGIKYMQVAMVNDYTQRAQQEYLKTSNIYTGSTWSYDDFVKAATLLNREGLDGFFIIISPTIEAQVKINLQQNLKYIESFVRNSYIGHINNLPVFVSKMVPENTAILAHKSAVTAFLKAGTAVERKREPNEAKNKMWIRKWDVVALTREDLCVMMKGTGADMAVVTPVVKNVGAEAVKEADGTIRIVGEKVTAGVPTDYASLFTLPLEDGVIVELDGIIPSAGADITITSLGYKPYFEAGDPNISKVGNTYQKSKHYDGTDPDLAVILLAGKRTTVKVGNSVYRIAGDYTIRHYE